MSQFEQDRWERWCDVLSFHKDGDYTAILDLLATAKAKYPVKLFGVCLTPDHSNLVVQPDTPSDWLQWIDQPVFDHELTTLRTCVNRQQPFGAEEWQATTAAALGLESTLRRRGRPLKVSEK